MNAAFIRKYFTNCVKGEFMLDAFNGNSRNVTKL